MTEMTRRARRFPAQVESVTVVARIAARVLDESQSGIALSVADPSSLAVGQEVDVVYAGAAMPAVVRRVHDQADGACVVGLQWK
jgi:hypothetical protein